MAKAPPRRPKAARVDPDRAMESAVAGVVVAVVVAAAKEPVPKEPVPTGPVPMGPSPAKVRKVQPASRVAKVRPGAKPMVWMVSRRLRVPQEMRGRGRRVVLARIVPAKAQLARAKSVVVAPIDRRARNATRLAAIVRSTTATATIAPSVAVIRRIWR
jgi:hypothetical protein